MDLKKKFRSSNQKRENKGKGTQQQSPKAGLASGKKQNSPKNNKNNHPVKKIKTETSGGAPIHSHLKTFSGPPARATSKKPLPKGISPASQGKHKPKAKYDPKMRKEDYNPELSELKIPKFQESDSEDSDEAPEIKKKYDDMFAWFEAYSSSDSDTSVSDDEMYDEIEDMIVRGADDLKKNPLCQDPLENDNSEGGDEENNRGGEEEYEEGEEEYEEGEEEEDEEDNEKDDSEENEEEDFAGPTSSELEESKNKILQKMQEMNSSGSSQSRPRLFGLSGSGPSDLDKIVRGHLNKITGTNCQTILKDIEQLYQTHARGNLNTSIIQQMLKDCKSEGKSIRTTLAGYGGLIGLLHFAIGFEVSGQLVEDFVKRFFEIYSRESAKVEAINVLLFLQYLFLYKVIKSVLIFDILGRLLDRFQDLDIEYIEFVVANCGIELRGDNPSALKQIILQVQKKANDMGVYFDESARTATVTETSEEMNFSKRVQFMLTNIVDLKNNKMKPVVNPIVSAITKLLPKAAAKAGKLLEPLDINLEDVETIETRGRRWLIGSAWKVPAVAKKEAKEFGHVYDEKLLKAAKEQHMNTDIKRALFCIIMTSDDYVDAFVKIQKLNLQKAQKKEIVFVIMHCALQEATFNPYYLLLCQRFCSERENAFSFNVAFWNKWRAIDSLSPRAISNLATLVGKLILADQIKLVVLKCVDFDSMTAKGVVFCKLLLKVLFTQGNLDQIRTIFGGVTASQATAVPEGILQFLLQDKLSEGKKTSSNNNNNNNNNNKNITKLSSGFSSPKEEATYRALSSAAIKILHKAIQKSNLKTDNFGEI